MDIGVPDGFNIPSRNIFKLIIQLGSYVESCQVLDALHM